MWAIDRLFFLPSYSYILVSIFYVSINIVMGIEYFIEMRNIGTKYY